MKYHFAALAHLLCLCILSPSIKAQLNVVEYTLDNGLTVILNPDSFQNEVAGAVAINTGSKNDPIDATGISHYLEHLLFKGTAELGTANYEKEKPHLDSINVLYDLLGLASDEDKRDEIQRLINEQAVAASAYGMPNEFDKLLKSIGSTKINASTSKDLTIYYNNFPPNQLKKWLDIYAHRFQNPVFRSFQSELEVVYEEKNRAADNLQRRVLKRFDEVFYKDHPYGEKNTLGEIEHLKNPSLTKMYAYFQNYYVPNNMALILSGNFNVDKVKQLIEESFGELERKPFVKNTISPPTPFNGREVIKERITPIKFGILGFRTVPSFHEDELALEVISSLFQNKSETGLIDELKNKNNLMMAFSYHDIEDEAGNQVFIYVPKVFVQSLKNAEKLVLGQIEKLKNGQFSDDLLQSVKNELYKDYQQQLENVNYRSRIFASLFRAGKSWNEIKSYPEKIEQLSKAQIIEVANKYYGDDFLVFQSRTGFSKKEKLDKPNFQPVKADQSRRSTYAKKFDQIEELPIKNKFIDFENDLELIPLGDSSKLFVVKNPVNDIYELSIRFHIGLLVEPKLQLAADLMNTAYPRNEERSAFKTKIALLGSQYYFEVGSNFFELRLSGIESNLDQVLRYINTLLKDPAFEKNAMKIIYNSYKTDRKVEEEDAFLIAKAMAQYGLYGKSSVLLNRPTLKEIKKLEISDIKPIIEQVLMHSVSIHFTGKSKAAEIQETIENKLELQFNGISTIPFYQPLVKRSKNEVLILDNKKLVQSHLFFVKNSSSFQLHQYPKMELFNTYFDGGFSGILTQEIREYRSLAYSTGANFTYSVHPKTDNYFYTYVGCQADKTLSAAVETYDLIQDMPQKPERMQSIQKNLSLKQLSNYPSFRDLSKTVELYQMKGLEIDPNEYAITKFPQLDFKDVYLFYQENIKQVPTYFGIYGDSKRFKQEELSKIGKVRTIKRSEVISF
ncbi:MAG: insulinase family protein [Vicingaceae bacterium]